MTRHVPGRSLPRLAPALTATVDSAARVRALEQMLRAQLQFLSRWGLTPAEARKATREALRAYQKRPYRLAEAKSYELFMAIADILGAWFGETPYLDERGLPRALPVTGARSFATLTRRFLPEHDPLEVARSLIKLDVLARFSDGSVRPPRRTAVIARLNSLTIDRLPVLLHGLLSTIDHNQRPTRREGTRLERTVYATHLPEHLLPRFDAKMKQLAASLIDQADAWMVREAPAEGYASKSRTARVGVSVFAYAESNAPTVRKKSARRKTK